MVSVDLLKKLKVFRDVPPEALEKLARSVDLNEYQEGQVICAEGEKGEGFFVVLNGQVSVEKKLVHGDNARKIVARLGPEQFFGEMAFLQKQPYSATVVAQEQADVLVISRTALNDMTNKDPKVALDQVLTMMTGLSDRLRSTTQELVTVFEIARIVGLALSPQELAIQVVEQLKQNLSLTVSIAFYRWNPFNDEYSLLTSTGQNASVFKPTIETHEKPASVSGYYLPSPIGMSGQQEGLLLYYAASSHVISSGERQMIETVSAVLAPALSTARFREEEAARKLLQRTKSQGSSL